MAAVRPRDGSAPMGRGTVGDDIGVVLWCVEQARCEVSGGGEVGGRAASTSPHRLRSPPCSHTPRGKTKEKISALSTL